MRKHLGKIVAITIAVALTLFPLSSCFATEEFEYSYVDGFYIMSAALQASGITVRSSNQADAWEWLEHTFESFCNQAGLVYDTVFNTVQVGVNKAGQILIDNPFVQLVDSFGNYLKTTFGLSNNDTVTVVSPGTSIDGVTIYQLPLVLVSGNYEYTYSVLTAPSETYCVFVSDSAHPATKEIFFAYSTGSINEHWVAGNNNGDNSYNLSGHTLFGDVYYKLLNRDFDSNLYPSYTYDEINAALNSDEDIVTSGVAVYIDTLTINLPSDNPDFNSGDGGIIDLNAPWLSSLARIISYLITHYLGGRWAILFETMDEIIDQLDNSVMVENLPAIVSTSYAQDPGFSTVFIPLRGFVNTFRDGIGLVTNIAYRLPSACWAIFYAITSITVIFGALHMFKEH